MSIFGLCDLCQKHAFLVRFRAKPRSGETYLCQECCGVDPREYLDDENQHVVKALSLTLVSGEIIDDEQDI